MGNSRKRSVLSNACSPRTYFAPRVWWSSRYIDSRLGQKVACPNPVRINYFSSENLVQSLKGRGRQSEIRPESKWRRSADAIRGSRIYGVPRVEVDEFLDTTDSSQGRGLGRGWGYVSEGITGKEEFRFHATSNAKHHAAS